MDALTTEQLATLAGVLDELIPPSADGRLPGAGELGLASGLAEHVAKTPGALPALAGTLDTLAAEGFAALDGAARTAALRAFAARHPSFLPGLFAPACVRYYGEPRIALAYGLEARPPHPKGHALEPGDLGGLEAVRRRGRIYREA